MTTTTESPDTSHVVDLSYPVPNIVIVGDTVDPFFTLFLTENRRTDVVTRADQGIVSVAKPDLVCTEDPTEPGSRCIADSTVALWWEDSHRSNVVPRHFLELQLLPGEARSLAAALVHGADLADFPS
jgi:hypothetical protein